VACVEGAACPRPANSRQFSPRTWPDTAKLTASDEERTLARLRALRSDLIDPTIALHHGRVVKRTGDGVLIEFRSVVDAVRCAIEVQNGMAERNAGLPPERRIELRAASAGICFRLVMVGHLQSADSTTSL
jgi:class 3 adenylate cyclase